MIFTSSHRPLDNHHPLPRGTGAVADAIRVIERQDRALRCFVDVDFDGAREAARLSDRRLSANQALSALDGVPFGVKANISCAGLRLTAGLRAREHVRANDDAPVVNELKKLGAALVGTTNMPEAAVGATTNNSWFGTCRNPLNPERTAGGSSGGSAAAVAAGMCAFALGSDTLGSVRIPAAYCAVAGWKPSRDLVDSRGLMPLCAELDTVGVLAAKATQISTVAAALGLVANHPISARPTLIVLTDILTRGLDSEVRLGFEVALDRLVQIGYKVRRDDRSLPDLGRLRRALLLQCEVELAAFLMPLVDEAPDRLSPELSRLLEFGRLADPRTLADAQTFVQDATRCLAALLQEGIVVLPTTPHLAGPAGSPGPVDAADFTAWVNPLGACSVTVPTQTRGRTRSGLLPALQIVGAEGADAAVLSVASSFETAQ